jgi:Spy/CpxP family protein refolding chaperone
MRDRLQLTDAQVDAMRKALEERLRLVAALRAELGQRMATEQGTLDMEIRGVLTEEQYGKWRQILDEARASRRQRGAWRFGHGG